jgi:PAS domain S-box-containing protein
MHRAHYPSNGHEEDSVLIVNDVPEQLKLMDSLLRKAGYSVLTAGDGLEAFEVARRKRPDVVISDVSMPRMNGMEFCKLIRQDADLRSIPILLVSAYHKDTESVVEGLESGADDYLEVPYDSTRLVAKVSRLLERSKAEAILRESQERYRLLFESTPQPIWVYDEDTLAFLAVNEAAIRTYGYSREEFLSMTIDDIRSKEDIPALLIKTPAGIGEPLISSPWRHRRKDNSIIYVELTSHPLRFNGSNARLVIANDVSERKLSDEKQLSMHASLQQSAMEWRQTFNAIDFPVLIVDLEGRINRLNQAAEEIAGLETEEILGRDMAELGNRQPWKKAAELIKSIRGMEGPSSAEVVDETTNKTWAITLFLIHEFGSVGERVILIAQDITKRTQLEASLRQGEMMSLLGSLVAGVAHEVRNPLFGISSILDAFETRFSDRTEYLKYTNVLRDEVGRLTNLMEELLEYGKPFRGDLYPAAVDEVIAKSMRACLPAAEVAQVSLLNNLQLPLPKLMIDRRRLSKVFVNLIENAIQHSPSGGTVGIEAWEVMDGNQRWIDCAVKDSGPGILAEDQSQIFEPFFSKRRGGTGLGLAIAQRIMGEHGGRLIATNNPAGGACMTARFPVPQQEEIADG